MKNVSILVLLLTAMLILCACQEMPDASVGLTSSGEQLSTLPSGWSAVPQSPTTKPNPSAPTLPENCDKGHTFPDEALYCAVCGLDYYSATLDFRLSEDGTFYSVLSIGDCRRTKIIVPENYNGLPVEGIIFLNTINAIPIDVPESSVTHVILPDTIKSIGERAFAGYHSLVSINIPEGISRIEAYTFGACRSLVSLSLPDSVTYIGDYAFTDCRKLKDLYIPDGVTVFGEGAFSSCEALEEIRIPEEMTEIPQRLASYCTSLKKVSYGDNVTKIGASAFEGCTGLQSFVIKNTVTSIGSSAFKGCNALANIVIPDSVTTMGNNVFNECGALTSVVIPDTIAEIGVRTFYKCENLQSVVIGKGVKKFGHSVFEGCDQLKSIYFRGTQAEWAQIKAVEGPPFTEYTNPSFGSATIYFYAESNLAEPGNYWHYVDGKPTPWKTEE